MLKFYYHPSPNPAKVALFLEESGLPYEVVPVDTRKGEQFKAKFLAFSPNNRMPAIERYVKETNRLYGVLDRRLAAAPYLAGQDYSIADIAVYPWIVPWEMQSQDLSHFPALKRWFDAIATRPATVRAYERGAALKTPPVVTDDSRKILFGQTAATGR